ncbi:hypothetical protein RJ640_012082 [Escallonia rubra]|uniref:Apoptosis-antagonizing transcription factor C-terminal domain-containing protein n=1 Tax=Escallonia rubra TaxID=112253 RepID=A0AA88S4D8_9ASTE|nr:hypothetical protein RJ640_012082 [Escallonia rubra]
MDTVVEFNTKLYSLRMQFKLLIKLRRNFGKPSFVAVECLRTILPNSVGDLGRFYDRFGWVSMVHHQVFFDGIANFTDFYSELTKGPRIQEPLGFRYPFARYNVHEKIVNFMAPQPMDLPPMAPKLFENLFGLKTRKPTSVP